MDLVDILQQQQQAKQPVKQGFRLSDLLPAGGGIAGATAGGAAGTAIAPGIGTIIGAILGGALGQSGAEYGRQKLTNEETDTNKILKEAMWGGGSALGGEILGAGAKAIGIGGKVAAEGATKAGSLEKAAMALRSGIVKPQVAASPFMATEEANIVKTLTDLGLKGNAQAQKEQLPKIFNALTSKIQGTLTEDTTAYTAKSVKDTLQKSIQGMINYDEAIPAYTKAASKYTNQLVKSGGKEVSASDLFAFKQSLNKQLSKAFTKIEKGAVLTPQEEVGLQVWQTIDDLLPSSVKDLTRTQSVLYKASPGIKKGAQETLQIPVINQKVSAGGVQSVKSGIANTLSRVGQPTTAVQRLLGNVGSQAIGGMSQNQQPTDVSSLMGQDQTSQYGQQTDMAQSDTATADFNQRLATAMMIDLVQNKGKNISALTAIGKLLAPSAGPKLDTNTQKELMKLKTAETTANQIEQAYVQAGGGKGLVAGQAANLAGTLQLSPNVASYNAFRDSQIGPLARAISGEVGVLTDRDIKRAEGLLPKITDSPEIAQQKLSRLKSVLAERKQNVYSTPAIQAQETTDTTSSDVLSQLLGL